jgi:hypothetical protein
LCRHRRDYSRDDHPAAWSSRSIVPLARYVRHNQPRVNVCQGGWGQGQFTSSLWP